MTFGNMKPNVRMLIESLQIQRTFCAAVIFAYGVPCAIFFPRGSLNRREGYATDPSAALQQTSCLRQAARTGIGTCSARKATASTESGGFTIRHVSRKFSFVVSTR